MRDYINDWYYMEPDVRGNSFVRGPVSLIEMRTLFKEGKIHEKTQVRCGYDSFWHPIEDVLPLFSETKRRRQRNTVLPAFWKKMLLITFLVITCLITVRWAFSPKTFIAVQEGLGSRQEPLAKESITELTNEARSLNGLTDLTENDLLDTVAEERAKDMLDKQYFAHVSPTGEQASDVAQRVGYRYKIIAENIAQGLFLTNQKLIDGWMQSPGHRKNILSSNVREIGVSVVKGKMHGADTWVGVQIFGLQSPPVSDKSCTSPSSDLANQISVKKTEMQGLSERLIRLGQELGRENTSIGLERIAVGKDYKRDYDLNMSISAYNEKINRHNQLAAELRAKEVTLNSMIEEYNRTLQEYRNCQTSN
jgi:uncharacterized protein YkwD